MQDIHPSDSFGVTDLSQVDLGCLQILMPKELVLKEWDRHHSSEILAEKFDVPPDAVDARIEALNLR